MTIELDTHNKKVRDHYWKTFTGSVPRCMNAVSEGNWKIAMHDTMYFRSSFDRFNQMRNIVHLYMNDVIKFIIANRRAFRINHYSISLTKFKICKWMKHTNELEYNSMKFRISKKLLLLAEKGSSTEDDLRNMIKEEIAWCLEFHIIRL